MKYGINMMVWTTRATEAHEPLFGRIREWGFDGVELFLSPDQPVHLPAVKAILDRLGLQRTSCVVLPREAHLLSPQKDVHARGVKYLETSVDRTAELGASVMCGPLYAGLGEMTGVRRTQEEWKRAVESLQTVARRAEKLGITLFLEPLNRFETYFLNTLEDTVRLIQDIGAPNVKIHFDTFHANIEEKNPAKALKSVGKFIGHVHISENDRGIPGSGHVDWRGVLLALKEIGYDGWLVIESFPEPEPELATAASIWRDLAPSGDALAHQGLQFIRGLAKELGV